MNARWIFLAPLAILGFLVFVTLGGVIVLLLWNWLLPTLFGLPEITFWQALGLLALCRILFGGFGGGGRRGRRGGDRGRYRSRFRRRMRERCASMTSEERERFRQRMRERWGFDPAKGDDGENAADPEDAPSSC